MAVLTDLPEAKLYRWGRSMMLFRTNAFNCNEISISKKVLIVHRTDTAV